MDPSQGGLYPMGSRNRSWKTLAALQCLIFVLGTGGIASAQQPAGGTGATISDCRLIQDEHARLLCYDQLPGAAPAPASAGKPKPQAPVSGVAESPEAAAPPVRPPAPVQQINPAAQNNPYKDYGLPASERGGAKPPNSITVKVAQTGLSGNRKLRITTTEGMVWEQTVGVVPEAPAPGTVIVIRNGSVGGHWCQINKWTAVRCQRVDRPTETRANAAQPVASPSAASNPAPYNTAAPTPGGAPVQSSSSPALPQQQAAAPSPASSAPVAGELRASYGLPHSTAKDLKEITVKIASTGLSGNRKLRFTTTDGMIWEQTIGPVPEAPKTGAEIVIRSAAMGGHWCQMDKWHAVRCKRVQ